MMVSLVFHGKIWKIIEVDKIDKGFEKQAMFNDTGRWKWCGFMGQYGGYGMGIDGRDPKPGYPVL